MKSWKDYDDGGKMLGIINFKEYLVACVVLALIPGNDTMFILGKTLGNGRRAGVISALGVCNGILVHTLLAGFGLSLILKKSELAFNIVKSIGAIYLIYLGVKAILEKSGGLEVDGKLDGKSLKKTYIQGILNNVLNPKVALFFIGFLPPFIDVDKSGNVTMAFIVLGLISLVISGIWNVGLAFYSGILMKKMFGNNSNFIKYTNKISGIIFIILGLNLFLKKLG